jgi:energy-coupling factor transporter ATP-binding protein EcfA2
MITFNSVSLIYPHSLRTVFEDLSFTIEEGEMVLVIGATGSGKSSLLRLINGLVPYFRRRNLYLSDKTRGPCSPHRHRWAKSGAWICHGHS